MVKSHPVESSTRLKCNYSREFSQVKNHPLESSARLKVSSKKFRKTSTKILRIFNKNRDRSRSIKKQCALLNPQLATVLKIPYCKGNAQQGYDNLIVFVILCTASACFLFINLLWSLLQLKIPIYVYLFDSFTTIFLQNYCPLN